MRESERVRGRGGRGEREMREETEEERKKGGKDNMRQREREIRR